MSTATAAPPPPVTTYEQAEARWLATRNTFIGGSEIYKLFNIPQYGKGCARALGYEKLGAPTEVVDRPDDALLRRGTIMEPLAAAMYEEKTGRKVRRPAMDEWGFSKVQRHSSLPFLGVHTDRLILAGSGTGNYRVSETGDLELKSHGEGPYLQMVSKGLPAGHSLQVQHSMLVTGHTWGALAVIGVFHDLPLREFDIPRNDVVIDSIKQTGEKFWKDLEAKKLAEPLPDADDLRCQTCAYRMECRGEQVSASAMAYLKKQTASKDELVIIKNPDLTADVAALRELKEQDRILNSESKAEPGVIGLLEDKIKAQVVAMGIKENEAYVFPGIGKLTNRHTSYSGLDAKGLKAAHPDIFEKFYIKGRASENTSLRLWPFDL